MGIFLAGLAATATAPALLPIVAPQAAAAMGASGGLAGIAGTGLGAKSPFGIGASGGGAAEKLGRAARAAALYKPSKFEKAYQDRGMDESRRLETERKRLARAKGGFTSDQVRRMIATGSGAVRSAVAERAAQLARGGSIGVGQSGVQEAAKRQLQKQGLDQIRKITSDVREADVAELEKQRQAFNEQKAQQEQRELMASQLERQRRTQAVQATQPRVQKKTSLRDRVTGGGENVGLAKSLLSAVGGGQ